MMQATCAHTDQVTAADRLLAFPWRLHELKDKVGKGQRS